MKTWWKMVRPFDGLDGKPVDTSGVMKTLQKFRKAEARRGKHEKVRFVAGNETFVQNLDQEHEK